MEIINRKLQNPEKFTSFGYTHFPVYDKNRFNSDKEYKKFLLDREMVILIGTGFEYKQENLRLGKQYIDTRNRELKTSYDSYHSQSTQKWKKSQLKPANFENLIKSHVFSKYSNPSPTRSKKIFNKDEGYCLNDYDFACTSRLISSTISINQSKSTEFSILHIDIDSADGINILKKVKNYFNADIQCSEVSPIGRVHASFVMNYHLNDHELGSLQKHLKEKFGSHIDVRKTTTVMRYWNSHSYKTGYFNSNKYVPFESHEKWQDSVLSGNPSEINILEYLNSFLDSYQKQLFKERHGFIKEQFKLNIKHDYTYNENVFQFKSTSTNAPNQMNFYYGKGERHHTLFNKGLAIYAYSISGDNNYEEFKSIILSFDTGSDGHRNHIEAERLIQGYYDSVRKLSISKNGKILQKNIIFDNSDLLSKEVKSLIEKLSTHIINSEFKNDSYKQTWYELYPKFINIIIAREFIKQKSSYKPEFTGFITPHLKKQLENPNIYKFLSQNEIKIFKKSFTEFNTNKFSINKALSLFFKYICNETSFNIDNKYTKKTCTYIPFVISKRYSLIFTKGKSFINNIVKSIEKIVNYIIRKKENLYKNNSYNIIMFDTFLSESGYNQLFFEEFG